MEHLLFHLVLETIQAFDRRLQKPLGKVIPDLALLRADPRTYLANTVVRIGPKKRHALSAVLGLVSAVAVTAAVVFLMEMLPRPKRPDLSRAAGIVATFLVVLFFVRHYCMKWFVGGAMTLQPNGAELVYRDRTLFLPWELFHATGSVFEPEPKIAVVPIDPTVPVAVSEPDGEVTAVLPDELDLPQAASSDVAQLAIKDHYEVRVGELAALILDIGEKLNDGDPRRSTETVAAPFAMPDTDGTLRVQLTQLPFPPFCAGCGVATTQTLEMPVAHKKLRNKIEIPFCDACAHLRSKRKTRGAIVGGVVGLISGFLVGLLFAEPRRNMSLFLTVSVIFSAIFLIPMSAIGMLIGRDNFATFAFKDYQPEKGTVKLWFRSPERIAPLLRAMGLAVMPAAVGDKP